MERPTDVRILASRAAVPLVSRELSRRGFLSVAAGAGTVALLAACTPNGGTTATPQATGGALEDSLSIYTWGIPPLAPPFRVGKTGSHLGRRNAREDRGGRPVRRDPASPH